MVSDGALSAGVAALEEQLRDWPTEGTMQALAETVADGARKAEQGHTDDITAVALRLYRATPAEPPT